MIKAYRHSGQYCSPGKIQKVLELAQVYRQYYNFTIRVSTSQFYRASKLPKYLPTYPATSLSQRYKQTCGSQVKGNLDSWLSNNGKRFIDCVMGSTLADDQKKTLLTINKLRLWFTPELFLSGSAVSSSTLKLARKIFHQVKGRIPVMRNPSMILDKKVANRELSKTGHFDYWIKLSTLEKRNPVYLPVKSYPYYEKKEGVEKNVIQVIVKPKREEVDFAFVKEIPKKSNKSKEVLGIDLGVIDLINSSSGNKYGLTLYPLLKKYDAIIQKHVKGRMKSGFAKNSPWLDELYDKVRNLIKNEVGRALNRLISEEKPKILVIEKLTNLVKNLKKDRLLSKRMRRLLINSGISQIQDRLREKCRVHDIEIVEINPAYTSQECHKCHFIDRKNRSGKKFCCKFCGNQCDADYNGSVNVRNRRSIPDITIYTPYRKVKEIVEEFYGKASSLSSRQDASDREAVSHISRAPPEYCVAELSM